MRGSWNAKLSSIFGPKPPLHWFLLCIVSAVVLIALLGSSSSTAFNSATTFIRPDIYLNYRRLNEKAADDYLELRSLGSNQLKDVGFCTKETENYVPCYNVSANLLAGFKDGEEFDRHCEVSREQHHCLVPPPKDYRIPLTWPSGRDVVWSGNVKLSRDQFLSSGSMMKRLMLLGENQISFNSDEIVDGIKDYSHEIAEIMGLGNDAEFREAGVKTVLDIGCGFGSFDAHLVSLKIMVVCMAAYEPSGSQVQVALERGLPAVIGNFVSRQLPFPSLSFDMVHCAQCDISWGSKGGLFLIEVDRVLKPGGYLVLSSPKRHVPNLYKVLTQQEEKYIRHKSIDARSSISIEQRTFPICNDDDKQSYYKPLTECISGRRSKLWIPIQNRSSAFEHLEIYGIKPEDFYEDLEFWRLSLKNYWSLLSPLIFSDHPKRPGDEDPMPPYNMVRNVMDMNAQYGGLNTALLEAGKSVWVMNVVPVGERNTLPLIFDQGFIGILHNWCEPFPTYPRTYDMLHAKGLLSHIASQGCSTATLLFEMDRILRPEGWVIISDKTGPIEMARNLVTHLNWEARVIDLQNGSDQRLLVCQKPFLRK